MIEAFGSDAEANIKLNQKARELGLTVVDLKRQAQDNPVVFYRLMGINDRPAPTPTPPAPRNQQQTPVTPTTATRDRAFYEKLKATNPKQYFSPEMLQQRYRDEFNAVKAGKEW